MGGASRNGSVGGSSVFSSDEKFLKRVRLQMNEKPKKLKPFGIKHVPSVSGRVSIRKVGAPPGPRIWRPAGLSWTILEHVERD